MNTMKRLDAFKFAEALEGAMKRHLEFLRRHLKPRGVKGMMDELETHSLMFAKERAANYPRGDHDYEEKMAAYADMEGRDKELYEQYMEEFVQHLMRSYDYYVNKIWKKYCKDTERAVCLFQKRIKWLVQCFLQAPGNAERRLIIDAAKSLSIDDCWMGGCPVGHINFSWD